MLSIARIHALLLLKNPSTWVIIAFTAFFAWTSLALDLFAFDGLGARAVAAIVGTLEIAAVLLSLRGRSTGFDGGDGDGFRPALSQRTGVTGLELGTALGVGVGAALACSTAWTLFIVLYNLLPHASVGVAALVPLALAAEGAVAAAWAALATRWIGRVPAIAVVLAAFALARFGVPSVGRALLPSPLSLSALELAVRIGCGVLTTIGLSLLTAAVPSMGERGA